MLRCAERYVDPVTFRAAPILLFSLLGLAVLAPGAAAAPEASVAAAPKVVIFDLYPTPHVKPARVFFQADAGPYLDKLLWSGWGEATSTGTGVWTLDCSNGGPSCAPGDPDVTTYPARYILSDLGPCPRFGASAKSYRSGTVEIDRNGKTDKGDFSSDYDFCAKRPTSSAAKGAIKRYVQRHHKVARVTFGRCRVTGETDLECRAYWTKSGRRHNQNFEVFARMNGPLGVITLFN